MSIFSLLSDNKKTYCCKCDICGKTAYVNEDLKNRIYNGAQAARSIHWSFGKDKSVKCDVCRQYQINDHYQAR